MISMLIRKFLAGTLGDSLLPVTKNKKKKVFRWRHQVELQRWTHWKCCQTSESPSSFPQDPECEPLKSKFLYKAAKPWLPRLPPVTLLDFLEFLYRHRAGGFEEPG